ncbi:hypothetical protein IW261DRAFT_1420074 [Armillaria novae-zelandiae]|uniref:Uncharacterized protein n=1 Tax=Armillaria novae-zelandiae TaxID=153914 RepID=A0AA39P7F7_9AGAR|nr:hypothetical protein IW261DRAFT_1420074 [Armillaria novae-zelandiae]
MFIDLYLVFVICVSMLINYYHLRVGFPQWDQVFGAPGRRMCCSNLLAGEFLGSVLQQVRQRYLRQLLQRSLHPAQVQPYWLAGNNDQDGGGNVGVVYTYGPHNWWRWLGRAPGGRQGELEAKFYFKVMDHVKVSLLKICKCNSSVKEFLSQHFYAETPPGMHVLRVPAHDGDSVIHEVM